MKTENTLENKAKFFAIYWGQRIISYKDGFGGLRKVEGHHIETDEPFLQLKPLKSISDDDIKYCNSLNIQFFKDFNQKQVDYLRSKGYSIGYMDLSVQDIIDYGWIKLVEP